MLLCLFLACQLGGTFDDQRSFGHKAGDSLRQAGAIPLRALGNIKFRRKDFMSDVPGGI